MWNVDMAFISLMFSLTDISHTYLYTLDTGNTPPPETAGIVQVLHNRHMVIKSSSSPGSLAFTCPCTIRH